MKKFAKQYRYPKRIINDLGMFFEFSHSNKTGILKDKGASKVSPLEKAVKKSESETVNHYV